MRPSLRSSTPTSPSHAGAPARSSTVSSRTRAWVPSAHACTIAMVPIMRLRARCPRCRSRSGTACWGSGGRRTRSRRATGSSTRIPRAPVWSTGCRDLRCGCGAMPSTRSVDGTSATSCTWRTWICVGGCDAAASASRTNRPARSSTSRARRRHGTRTACWSSTTAPRGDSPADASAAHASALLPFAAVYLVFRATLAIAEHAWRAVAPVRGG